MAEKNQGLDLEWRRAMKAIRQRFLSWILIFIFAAGMALGVKNPVMAAEKAGEAPSHVLVAYFSCTENTKTVAEHAADILNVDIYEITPSIPYTPADLNYSDSSSRSSLEQNNPSARPEISGNVENMEKYDTILIGYPKL